MSRRRFTWAVFAGLLMVSTLTAGAFLALYEPVETPREVGPSGEAVRNPYHAAQLLLSELGASASPRYGLGQLPPDPHGTTLLVLTQNIDERHQLTPRLLDHAQRGGHVVVVPASEDVAQGLDPLLNAVDVVAEPVRWDASSTLEVGGDAHSVAGVSTLFAPAARSLLHTCPGTFAHTEDGDPVGVRATCPYGDGTITVLATPQLLTNYSLRPEQGDNAVFLWDTVATSGSPPEQVFLVLRGEVPSFLALLWGRAWPALLSLGALLLGVALWQGQRLGPLATAPPPTRRSLVEHLDAAGALLWRHGEHTALLAPMRSAVLRRLSQRQPALAQLEGPPLVRAVVEATGQPAERVEAALLTTEVGDRTDFVARVQALQALWSAKPV